MTMHDSNFFKDKARNGTFSNHISNSIPGIYLMDKILVEVGLSLMPESILDFGCTSDRVFNLFDEEGYQDKYTGVDVFERENTPYRFCKIPERGFHNRLENIIQVNNCDLVLSIFTMQFINPKDREKVMSIISESDCLIAEKLYSGNEHITRTQEAVLRQYKLASFSSDDILEKDIFISRNMKIEGRGEFENKLSRYFGSFTNLYSFLGFNLYYCKSKGQI